MQPPDRPVSLGQTDPPDEEDATPGSAENIRDLQRRRRDSQRLRADIQAILATPDEEDADEEQPATLRPAPEKVWVVFRGTSWTDPGGTLRESDNIVGIYASEDGARRMAAALNTQTAAAAGEGDAWYQPYSVEA